MTTAKLESAVYPFEDVLPDLASPPIAARRALDHAGLRLSVEGWRALPRDARERLTLAGVPERVDVGEVARLARETTPPALPVAPAPDPDASSAPRALAEALPPGRSLAPERWSRLRSVDRYALWHTYRRAAARGTFASLDEAVRAVLAKAPAPQEPQPEPRPAPPEPAPAALSNHLTRAGEVHMVDVAPKPATQRRAVARGAVRMRPETLARLVKREAPKGEVLATARLAAIMAAKRTPELIPLCHSVALTHVEVAIEPDQGPRPGVVVTATVDAVDRTGCEMEAMVAVTTACLTVYDMLKGIDRDMVISDVALLEKNGGRSGHYRREGGAP